MIGALEWNPLCGYLRAADKQGGFAPGKTADSRESRNPVLLPGAPLAPIATEQITQREETISKPEGYYAPSFDWAQGSHVEPPFEIVSKRRRLEPSAV